MDFTVAIPTYNGAERLPEVLARLQAQVAVEQLRWEVIVCDNHSSDRTTAIMAQQQRQWRQIWPKEVPLRYCFAPERGAAHARQRAVEAAQGDWIGFLDDDNWPAPDWVAQAHAFAQAHPQAGAIGSRIQAHWLGDASQPGENRCPAEMAALAEAFAPFLAIINRGDRPHRYDPPIKVLPPGAGLVVQRRAWLEAVPPRLFLNHSGRQAGVASEDLEAVIYLRRGGWELWHNPAMAIEHALPLGRLDPDALLGLFRCIGQSCYYIRLLNLGVQQRVLAWPLDQPLLRPLVWLLCLGLYGAYDLYRLLLHQLKPRPGTQATVDYLRWRCDRHYLRYSLYSPLFLAQRALGQGLDRWLDRWRAPNKAQVFAALTQAAESSLSYRTRHREGACSRTDGWGPSRGECDRRHSLCIIIPTHNRRASVLRLLEQLTQQQAQLSPTDCITLVVVDDGSDGDLGDNRSGATGSARWQSIAQRFPQVQVCSGDGNLWWLGSIVQGMAWAIAHQEPDFFVWLNDDLDLADDFLQVLVELCHQPNACQQVMGGIVRASDHPQWIVYSGLRQGAPLHRLDSSEMDQPILMETLAGNIVVLPRTVLAQVGFPDALSFPQNGGDYAYTKAVRRAGFRLVLCPRLEASTDYGARDVIRYMPYWMQWCLQRNCAARCRILRRLTQLKSNQNIWMFVHLQQGLQPRIQPGMNHSEGAATPAWRYGLCYADKLLKLMAVDFVPRAFLRPKVQAYLERWGVPGEVDVAVKR